MGDWNAVVGESKEEKYVYVSHYGLGFRSYKRKKLVEFCKRRQFYFTDTRFTHDRIKKCTKPGASEQYQSDYIVAKYQCERCKDITRCRYIFSSQFGGCQNKSKVKESAESKQTTTLEVRQFKR